MKRNREKEIEDKERSETLNNELLEYLIENKMLIIAYYIIINICGYFYSIGINMVFDAMKIKIRKTKNVTNGLVILITSLSAIIVFFFMNFLKKIEFYFFIIIGLIYIICLIISTMNINEILLSNKPYKRRKKLSKILLISNIVMLMAFGCVYFVIFIFNNNRYTIKTDSLNLYYIIIILKLLINMFYIFTSFGFINCLSNLFDLRKYRIKGKIVKSIYLTINNVEIENNKIFNKEIIEGIIIAEDKRNIIFKPNNYCAIKIEKKDIELMTPLPEHVDYKYEFYKIMMRIKEFIKLKGKIKTQRVQK